MNSSQNEFLTFQDKLKNYQNIDLSTWSKVNCTDQTFRGNKYELYEQDGSKTSPVRELNYKNAKTGRSNFIPNDSSELAEFD